MIALAHAENGNIVNHRLRDRLITVCEIIRSRYFGATFADIRRELAHAGLDCHERTIARDCETLEALGVVRWEPARDGQARIWHAVREKGEAAGAREEAYRDGLADGREQGRPMVTGRILSNGVAEITATIDGQPRAFYLGRLQVAILKAAGRTPEGRIGRGDLYSVAYPDRALDAFTDNDRASLSRALRKSAQAGLLVRTETDATLTEAGRLVAGWLNDRREAPCNAN